MGLVSARVDDEDEAVLRRAKVNMSELLRNAAHAEARRLLRGQALQDLEKIARQAKPATSRSQDIIRGIRDG